MDYRIVSQKQNTPDIPTRSACSFSQNFYKTELNKEEMYIRYIHKLYDLHLKAQNFTGTNGAQAGGVSRLLMRWLW